MNSIFSDKLTPPQVASILNVTTETLSVWRCTKRYPLPYIKVGRKIFYRSRDIEAFLERQMKNNEEVA